MERIKEELACLRLIATIGAAVDVSLLGWLAQNYHVADIVLLALVPMLIVLVTIGIILIGRVVLKRLNQLD